MKKYISVISAAIALVCLSGCKDFLTEEPVLAQSNELTLSTLNGVNKAVAGAYSPLASTTWYGANFIIYNEMKTGNGKKYFDTEWDTGRLKDVYNINFSENSTYGLWGTAYYVISAANNAMDALPNVEGDEATKNNLKAEALFIRALAHFDLVRTYAQPYSYTNDASHDGVPVVLHTDSDAKPARESVAKVYEQIVADLTEAESIIDPSYVRSGVADAKSAVTIYAIQAFLSRVYLYMGQWQKAADYATKVIDSKKYTLWTAKNLEDAACYTENVPKGGEIIFEVYGIKTNSYDGYHDGISPMTGPDGYGDAGAAADLYDSYEESDVRSTLFQEEDGVVWTAKYAGKGLGTPDVSNTILFRLSEMYLNRAEAIIEGASIAGVTAASDLSTIAESRGATTQPATRTGVYTERNKELAWEGHLWFDLARTGRDMTRTDFIGDESAREVKSGDYRWALPIPQREYGVNPNLTHNPGYTN